MYRPFLFLIFFHLASGILRAQPTTPLTLNDAETLFQTNNLQLLAQQLNIGKAEAEVLQAKLFQNPVISFEQNIYNRTNGKYFDLGRQGEQIVEIEQLIYIAGQRNNRIRLEKVNQEIALFEFEELLQTLRSELRENFITLYYANRSLLVLSRETEALERLLSAWQIETQHGNVSMLERVRLEALLLSLRQEATELQREKRNVEQQLCLLTGLSTAVSLDPVWDEAFFRTIDPASISYDQLLALLPEQPSLKRASANVRASEANIRLQRSQAFPEINIKGIYDRAGNFCDDYFAVGLNFTLPVFNRNQGNRKSARLAAQQQALLEQAQREEAQSELRLAYADLTQCVTLYQQNDAQLEQAFDQIIQGAATNFTARNISLVEFVDYMQSYKETNLQLFSMRKSLFLAADALNTVVGQDVICFKSASNTSNE